METQKTKTIDTKQNSNMQSTNKLKTNKTVKIQQEVDPLKQEKEEFNKKIAKLRQQKKEAIRNKDFDRAEEIDQQIIEINKQYELDVIKKAEEDFRIKTREIIGIYETKFQEAAAQQQEAEKQVRIRVNNSFEELRKQQQEELINLEKEHANDRLREQLRPIPDVITLNQQAAHAATVGDYQGARNYKDQAAILQENDVEKRLRKVDEEFEAQIDALILAQRTQLQLLSKNLLHDLEICQEKARNRQKLLLENREAALIAHYNTNGQSSDKFDAILAQECYSYNVPVPRGFGSSASVKKQLIMNTQSN